MGTDRTGTLGALLRAFREGAGLSQEELAERAGLSPHAISALERGTRTRPYPHTLRSLAAALDLTDDERTRLLAAVPARSGRATDPAPAPAQRRRDLPTPTTSLVGRSDDLARVADLLRAHRLVTLVGPGGVGKTRLALAVAQHLRDSYADGVRLVELAPLRDAGQVLPAVADAVDATPAPGRPLADELAGHLQGRHLLLVLDNVEHLLEVAPELAVVLESAPDLTVLATSRAPLRVRGEAELAIDPLALPSPERPDSPAVELLLDRAESVSPGWGTRPDDRTAVEAICTRLAGLPLALELAAARARLLDPHALLDRLDGALQAGPRDLPARQRTMRATLDWSHGLLDPDEQALLRLLGVFVGGTTLDDLERVAARVLPACRPVVDLLESLVAHSLVIADGGRFRMLEPVAQYAGSLLEEAGEWEQAARAHATHFRDLAEEVSPRYRDGGQVVALQRADADHANLTAAVERALALDDVESAARTTWALWLFWWLRGHLAHGRRLSEDVLARRVPDGPVHARAALAAATMSFAMDDVPAARAWWERALEHAGGDPVILANSVAGLGLADLAEGDLASARTSFAAAVEHADAGGADAEWTWALSHVWLGTVALLEGSPADAAGLVQAGLGSAQRRGDRLASYIALYNLFQVELVRGDLAAAHQHLDDGVRLSLETGDQANLAYLLDASAVLAATAGQHARVPLVLGAAQAIRETLGSHGYGYYRPDPAAIAAAADDARGHLGSDRYDDALDTGRGLSPHDAAALVLTTRA